MMKAILGVLLFSGMVVFGWWVWQAEQKGVFEVLVTGVKRPEPDKERYEVLVKDLARWRGELSQAYKKARTESEKKAVEHDARVILEMMMPEMMRCWLGTPYDFNGTAEKPGEGQVACGYFVSTVIRDAGFKVDRFRLAQQPSENIMRSFLPSKSCLLKVGAVYSEYVDWVEEMERGIYLVGLDTHVGFIVNHGEGMRFIHSSGLNPWSVVDEGRDEAGALKRSKWRMIGGFTGDVGVIRTWLGGERVKVKR